MGEPRLACSFFVSRGRCSNSVTARGGSSFVRRKKFLSCIASTRPVGKAVIMPPRYDADRRARSLPRLTSCTAADERKEFRNSPKRFGVNARGFGLRTPDLLEEQYRLVSIKRKRFFVDNVKL